MRWRWKPHGIAYFAVAAMMLLLGLQGCTVVRGPLPPPPCTPPPGEAQLLADYQSQMVLNVLPASMTTESGQGWSARRYCDQIGTDSYQYSKDTAVRLRTTAPSGWSAAKLLSVYGPAATESGWSLISKVDRGASCGLSIAESAAPSCVGTGILFCKVIDGVTTDFMVSSDVSLTFNVRIFARRDSSGCANSS
jgi:hypothetical protein